MINDRIARLYLKKLEQKMKQKHPRSAAAGMAASIGSAANR